MKLTTTQRELISRGTMAFIAIGLAVGATKLLLMARKVGSVENAPDSAAFGGLLILLVVVMYILSFTFGCFVFCAWDQRKSNTGLVMTIGDKVQAFFTFLVENIGWF